MSNLLSTLEMARFAARGFLRFDSVVPQHLNQAFLDEIGHVDTVANAREHYRRIMGSSAARGSSIKSSRGLAFSMRS